MEYCLSILFSPHIVPPQFLSSWNQDPWARFLSITNLCPHLPPSLMIWHRGREAGHPKEAAESPPQSQALHSALKHQESSARDSVHPDHLTSLPLEETHKWLRSIRKEPWTRSPENCDQILALSCLSSVTLTTWQFPFFFFFDAEAETQRFFFCFLFFFNFFYFIFWLRWVFVAVHRLSLVAVSGGYSSLRCVGFSLRWLLLLRSTGSRHAGFSRCGSRALEHRLSSYWRTGLAAPRMWDLPGPGLEPVSPALAGGFLTTAPPGKPPS